MPKPLISGAKDIEKLKKVLRGKRNCKRKVALVPGGNYCDHFVNLCSDVNILLTLCFSVQMCKYCLPHVHGSR